MADVQQQLLAAASSPLPTAGSCPTWEFKDFFLLQPAEEHRLKLSLAKHLGFRYDTVNMGEKVACPVDGIDPYEPNKVKYKHMNFLALCRDMVRTRQRERL